MDAVAQRFAENLKAEVERSPYSQEEITARAEIHRSQMHNLTTGKQMPRLDTAIKLAGALGVSLEKLIGGITWTPADTPSGGYSIQKPKGK